MVCNGQRDRAEGAPREDRRRHHRQGDGRPSRPAHGRRSPAPLPAQVCRARRADPPVRAAARRARHGGRGDRRHPLPHVQPRQGRASGGDAHRRQRAAPARLLRQARGPPPREGAAAGAARDVRGQGLPVQPQAAAVPPRLRAARRGRRFLGGGGLRGPAAAPVPGLQAAGVLADRQVGRRGARLAGRGRLGGPGRPAARGAARPSRSAAAARGVREGAQAAHQAGRRGRPVAAEVGRGLRAPGRARPAPQCRRPAARGAQTPGRGRPAARVRRAAAVHAHRRPAPGQRRDLRGPRGRSSDAPAAPGRGRQRQDAGGAARHAGRGRHRGAVGAAGAHRGPGAAAPPLDHRHDGRSRRGRHARRCGARHQGHAAHRLDGRAGQAGGAAGRGHRRGGHRHRHARADRGRRAVPRPRSGGGGRAAPVRRGAARRPACQGRTAAAPAGDDRDADSAHGRHDGLRGPGDLGARRAAAGPFAHRESRRPGPGQAALPHPRLGAGARGGRRRPPGVRGLPAHRRRGRDGPRDGGPGHRGRRRGR